MNNLPFEDEPNIGKLILSAYPFVVRQLKRTDLLINPQNCNALLFIAVRSMIRIGMPKEMVKKIFEIFLELQDDRKDPLDDKIT